MYHDNPSPNAENGARCAGLSDIGRRRETNEDQFLIADVSKTMVVHSSTLPLSNETRLFSGVRGQLLLVADGMGGHAAGEVASQLSVDAITQHVLHTMPGFFRLNREHEDELRTELVAAMLKCEQVVHAEALAHPEERGMGTTITLAYVIWPRMFVVHVGDSRCYLFRAGRIKQLTHDHTMAQALIDEGVLSEEAAKETSLNHVLVRSIGRGHDSLPPDVYAADLEPDDTILLCTDGLTDRLSDVEIAQVLLSERSEIKQCQALIDAANAAGGNDNITVVVSHFPSV